MDEARGQQDNPGRSGADYSVLARLAVLAASVLGVLLALSIPNAVFPEMSFNRAVIIANSGDLPAAQMLIAVTRPLEQAAYGVQGTTMVRSNTTRGSVEIDVNFSSKSDASTDYQLLNAALSQARGQLPPDTTVDTRLLTSSTYEILDISLSSPVRGLTELTDIAFYEAIPGLHRIPGVYLVQMSGDKYREFIVRLDPGKLVAYRLTPQDVVAGLARANVVASAGRVMDTHRMLLTVVSSNLSSIEDLAGTAIASVGGQPIKLSDLADMRLGIREDYVRCESQDGPAVLIGVSRQPGGNTVEISRQAHQLVDEFRRRYPDVRFSFSYDQARLVDESFNSVRDAIVIGLVLAVLVVLAFTLSPLSALVSAIVVPCTIASTFCVMKAASLSFNMMTLGGLAAGIGLFIDDAIVMIEAIERSLSRYGAIAAAVKIALRDLSRPLIASTMTVIVVFLPLAFISGVTGMFFRSLAITLGSGLMISLVLALFFTPALEKLIGRWRGQSREPGRVFRAALRLYDAMLWPFLRFPLFAILAVIASLATAGWLATHLGTDYLPEMDEGAFVLDYITPAQSTLNDTDELLRKIETILKDTPEVAAFARRTGTQRGFQLSESNTGDITVQLKANRSRGIDEIMDSVRERVLGQVPGVQVDFSQVLQDLIGDLSGTPQPIEVKVFGSDQSAIEGTAKQVAARLKTIPGLVDVFDGVVLSNPEEEVFVDPRQAQRYGLSASDVHDALHSVIEGTVATQLRVGDRLIAVRVRYPSGFHLSLDQLSQVLLRTPDAGNIALSQVAGIRWLGETTELNRERLRPVVHVTARIEGVSLGRAMARVRRQLESLTLPAGVTLEYGGLYIEQQQAFSQLTVVMVVGTVLMFLVTVWEFRRLTPAFAVLLGALSCLAGSLIALELAGITLNISSFMGLIMVAGITAKNGILLLDQADREVAAGVSSPRDALARAAEIRLRPIMMTTLATAAGLLPLALGVGAGAKIQQPLAITVLGGLAFAVLFSTALAGGLYLIGTADIDDTDANDDDS
ncbi:MAG TPA: efflux RND transporter permease subunit [Candidatus Binataceae bacterium]|nr:efflux RND transporter permease subunit [Candidatus Binataceae bacterium]